jgi:hypothetical protein
VRITPLIIPNRDSIPQNQPRPKDAVSKLDGTAASMGGIAGDLVLYARLRDPSFALEPLFACVAVVGEPPIKNDITPNKNKQRMILTQLLFSISIILFLELSLSTKYKDKLGFFTILRLAFAVIY